MIIRGYCRLLKLIKTQPYQILVHGHFLNYEKNVYKILFPCLRKWQNFQVISHVLEISPGFFLSPTPTRRPSITVKVFESKTHLILSTSLQPPESRSLLASLKQAHSWLWEVHLEWRLSFLNESHFVLHSPSDPCLCPLTFRTLI